MAVKDIELFKQRLKYSYKSYIKGFEGMIYIQLKNKTLRPAELHFFINDNYSIYLYIIHRTFYGVTKTNTRLKIFSGEWSVDNVPIINRKIKSIPLNISELGINSFLSNSEFVICCETCKHILPEQRCNHPQGCESDYDLWEHKNDCY